LETLALLASLRSQSLVRVDQSAYVRLVGDQEEALLTSAELAKRLSVSPRTVARWVQEGRLKPEYTTPGGKHRFRWLDVRKQLGLRDRPET
jgi:excisionase family DNA binding protein